MRSAATVSGHKHLTQGQCDVNGGPPKPLPLDERGLGGITATQAGTVTAQI